MTTRLDVSTVQNIWHDAQRVDKSDMDVEQSCNNQVNSAIVNNFMGSGVLPDNPQPLVLFDSDDLTGIQAEILAAGNFDGTGLDIHTQPSDSNLGNQIEVELTGSDVLGRLSVKVLIIGLSFEGELQLDRFYFYANEKQVTSKHYKHILTVMFNDFKGNNNCSRSLGGRIVMREAAPFELSRDTKMVAQDVMPDLFFRDFKPADQALGMFPTIQAAIGSVYDANNLNIDVTGRQPPRSIDPNDVTTRIGQKFQARSDNIQKVTLLLGVEKDTTVSTEHWYDWEGDLVVSIYPLQTTVNCPTQLVPESSIEYDPAAAPVAEVSFSQADLRSIGYVLTGVAQPLDIIFSNTAIAQAGGITVGNYYAVTFRRSGAANAGTIFSEMGTNRLDNSRFTIYSGIWTDVVEEDLWFQVWSDAAKVSDGKGYDAGNGIQYPKTTIDTSTGAYIDNEIGGFSLVNTGQSIVNTGIIQATTNETVTVQDERTGDNVYSRQQFVPSFSFVTTSELTTLKQTTEPLIIGCAVDVNPKVTDVIIGSQIYPGLAKGDDFIIINPGADLLSVRLVGRKLIPNNTCNALDYRIYGVELCVDGYGDVNGDGYINDSDITRASTLLGESIWSASTQQKIVDGYFSTLELLRADVDGDGYITVNDIDLITNYVNRSINSFPVGTSFNHLTLTVQQSIGRYDGYYDCNGRVRLDGYHEYNIVDPSSLSAAELVYDGYLAAVNIEASDSVFTTVPFPGVTYEIDFQPFWQDYLLVFSSSARMLPAAFTYAASATSTSCSTALTFECTDRNTTVPACDPGRNDLFVPANLIIGTGGEILRPNGDNYKVDVEIGTVILQLPDTPLSESIIDVFRSFVADRGDGFTNSGYAAMRYSDCTTVQPEDLSLNKIRFGVSLQSFSNLDGYFVDDIIGVYMDYNSGILKLTIKDLSVDTIYLTLVTKIQILVYLKKAGWNNEVLTVGPDEVAGLIS